MDTVLRQDLIDLALRATDAYLGVEKHAQQNGFATQQDIHDFTDPRYWEESFEELAREARLTLPAWAGQQRQADTRKT